MVYFLVIIPLYLFGSFAHLLLDAILAAKSLHVVRCVVTFPHELCLEMVCLFWVFFFRSIQQRVDWL